MARKILAVLALLPVFGVMPALCVLEYLSGVKMGIYRYVFMKNARLAGSVFTPEAAALIPGATGLLILIGLFLVRGPKGGLAWNLWRLYGALMLAGGYWLFEPGRFTPYPGGGWLTAPWFGLALLAAEGAWVLRTFLSGFRLTVITVSK